MPKDTKEVKEKLEEKLKYIGLDLQNIPDFLKKKPRLDFKSSKTMDEKNYKVYRYIPINKIELLLTPTDRLSTTQEKYKLSGSVGDYIIPDKEENIEKYTAFLNMLQTVSIEEIEHLEKLQDKLDKKVPFGVKYYDNYIWQIYYSRYTDKYFMLLPIKESEYASFFYVLKKQIETGKKELKDKIFVPIRYADYSEEFLTKGDIAELENYLWLFTKNWPSIYEVYDKSNKMSLQIAGETLIYEKIESNYKIKLTSKEEATKFYKLIKALFILQTEIPHIYNFSIKITANGGLNFYFNNKKISYDNLAEFIHKEYINIGKDLTKVDADSKSKEQELERLKILSTQKDLEYLTQEKQIATYLQCKKTFFGRVKYFIKYKKSSKNKQGEEQEEKETNKQEVVEETFSETKDNYTIEDLVVISEKYNQRLTHNKDLKLDIKSLDFKLKNIERKIKNASLYIEEIDKHKKSIFEFWKFATKDEIPQLDEPDENEKNDVHKLQRVFDYEQDLDDMGEEADKKQRVMFSKNELDSIFIATTSVLNCINLLKNKKLKDSILKENLENLKEEIVTKNILFEVDNFDVFGSMAEDKTKIKELRNKRHRENQKNKFKILNISKNTEATEYKETLKRVLKSIENSYEQTKALYNMSIYKALPADSEIENQVFNICNINPQTEIEECNTEKINLYKVNIKENTPLIYLTNAIYYDNYNKTLPIGMDVNSKVLLDLSKLDLELYEQKEFRFIKYINEKELLEVESKIIKVYEYDLIERTDK